MKARLTASPVTVAVVACVLAATACSPERTPVRPPESSIFTKGTITVALKNDQPGTSYLGGGYTWSGFDYDLAAYIARSQHVQMNAVDEPSDRRIPLLESGRIDLVISTFSYTADRARQVSLAGPYLRTNQGVLVKTGDTSIVKTADLKGKTVCAMTGSTSLDVIRRPGYGILPKEEPDFGTCVKDLRADRVQAISTDQVILYGYAQSDRSVRVVPDAVIGELSRYVVGLPPGHRADCAKVAAALRAFLGGPEWTGHFAHELPAVVNADPSWENHFAPSRDEVRCQT
jgi:glutamate transport system substrate-binding protein